MIHVAYVVHTFHMGGLERCVARLANHLPRSRFAPMVVCLNRNGEAVKWLRSNDVPIIELHKLQKNDPQAVRRLARVLRDHEIDVVHSHNWGTLVETALARRWGRVPYHVHAERGMELNDLQVQGWRSRLRGWAMRRALASADGVIAVAQSVRQHIVQRCNFPAERIRLMPNGVDIPSVENAATERNRLRQSLGIDERAALLGSVARLVPVKSFDTALDALARLLDRGHDIHFVLVGDGPEGASLRTKAEQAGLRARVHLVGKQTNVGSWLAAIDIYINCSLNEGMSQSILEAMAAGRPLVVTDVGDNAVLVNGPPRCGLVVPPRDPPALAEAVEQLVDQPEQQLQFSTQARERHATTYSIERMVQQYEELYAEICTAEK